MWRSTERGRACGAAGRVGVMGSEEKKAKKEKREARTPEDAAAREARKAAKRAKKEGGGGGGEGEGGGADGAVARVRVSPVPPGSDVAAIAAFLGVDASKVVVLSGEATAIMPDAAAASTLDETKFKGRFVRVVQDDFRPEAVAADASGEGDVRERAEHTRAARRSDDTPDAATVVEVECAGQTGRIIGKGGSKIREIEELTGCVLRVRQEEGVCEVSGRDVNAAVQEIKNIVQEGRERDGGVGHSGGFRDVPAKQGRADDAPASLPFGVPPPGSASRHDTGANDWSCACGSVNFARRSACFRCHAPRPSDGAGLSGLAKPPGRPEVSKPAAAAAVSAPTQGHDGDGYEVFVKYLPHETSEEEVAVFFAEKFGALKGDARLIRDQNGRCRDLRVRGVQSGVPEKRRRAVRRAPPQRQRRQDGNLRRARDGTSAGHAHAGYASRDPGCARAFRPARRVRGRHIRTRRALEGHSSRARAGGEAARLRHGPGGTRQTTFFSRRRFFPFAFFPVEAFSRKLRGFRFRFFSASPRARPVLRRTRRDENTTEPRKLFRMVNTRVATNISPIEIERWAEDGETRAAR
jgi:hypothetical protein